MVQDQRWLKNSWMVWPNDKSYGEKKGEKPGIDGIVKDQSWLFLANRKMQEV